MKRSQLTAAFALAVLMSSCIGKTVEYSGTEGAVRIALQQEEIRITKADEALPSVEDFEVEIYNDRALRLYRSTYAEAKDQTIKLNAGQFRLLAQHGDSLGAGFGKAYYLADEPFTVHGFADNGGKPDEVQATARLANVRLAVSFGESISRYYSDYYVVVRHSAYPKKQVKFTKSETRYGYIPGGDLYLEVYAQLGEAGGESHWVYYKSEAASYSPNDFVTFRVDAPERSGSLTVEVSVDRSVETIEFEQILGGDALPPSQPYFSYQGSAEGEYTFSYPAGFVSEVKDAVLSFNVSPYTEFASIVLHTESDVMNLEDIDLLAASDGQKAALEAYGITWLVPENYPTAYIDFGGAVRYVSDNAPFDAGTPSAVFTVTVTDAAGNSATGSFSLQSSPVDASIEVEDTDIWGWKFVAPKATLRGVDRIPDGAVIGLQYSADGSTWSSEVSPVSRSGLTLTFDTVTGLLPGTSYRLRTIVNHDDTNVSSVSTFTTEEGLQVGNGGFEEYTAQTYTTPVLILSDFNVTWWQLYGSESSAWWGVNALRTVETDQMATGYQDYKTYPAVALFNSGSYSGNSVMLATVYIGSSMASEIMHGNTNYPGEIFLGKANNQHKENWAKTSEGHAFASRPAALSFQHKFNPNGAAYYVSVQVLDASGAVIGQAEKNDATAAVNNWTRLTLPINYTVTNKKAASVRLSIRSSKEGGEGARKLDDISTLSGSHKIYCGNALYVDNVEFLYQ